MSIFGLSGIELEILGLMLVYGIVGVFVYFFLDLKSRGMKEGLALDFVLIFLSVVPGVNLVAGVMALFDYATNVEDV